MLNEWGVFGVLAAIVGLFLSVGAPALKLNATITRLQSSLENLQKDIDDVSKKNTESHRRLWIHNEKQDAIINDHDGRIERLEGRVDAYHGKN